MTRELLRFKHFKQHKTAILNIVTATLRVCLQFQWTLKGLQLIQYLIPTYANFDKAFTIENALLSHVGFKNAPALKSPTSAS